MHCSDKPHECAQRCRIISSRARNSCTCCMNGYLSVASMSLPFTSDLVDSPGSVVGPGQIRHSPIVKSVPIPTILSGFVCTERIVEGIGSIQLCFNGAWHCTALVCYCPSLVLSSSHFKSSWVRTHLSMLLILNFFRNPSLLHMSLLT